MIYLEFSEEEQQSLYKEINFYRPQSELENHRSTLKAYFHKKPPATVNEASATIE